ncbi:type II toxin-antitoxin system RelE/ParE family toxin [Shewanella sp. MBTL60-007]|uniref:type II toxin-antitoxin system RelE/ParE family toxin n=1 Tax=Shewanella sp. MBTL60-007 TaxID=2815911 RepID=UPI001BC18165|nr:type II toxin-antitoxin system RelE/ParE family toxin [Shewanella sp. MBTL60-007]GIU21001.1 hypothetical protein TUM3792_21360 [Shewanella sp. MBTL60-007]
MKWTVNLYDGVEEAILDMPTSLRARMIHLLELVQEHGANLGEPHSKSLGGGLFELRAKAKDGICRGLFCYLNGPNIIVLNAFVKKSQKTPKKELSLALKRMNEVKNDHFI